MADQKINGALYRSMVIEGALAIACLLYTSKTKDDMAQARRRMVFEELFLLCCGLQQLKERRKADSGIVFTSNGLDSFFEALPFTPTGAQPVSYTHLDVYKRQSQPGGRDLHEGWREAESVRAQELHRVHRGRDEMCIRDRSTVSSADRSTEGEMLCRFRKTAVL